MKKFKKIIIFQIIIVILLLLFVMLYLFTRNGNTLPFTKVLITNTSIVGRVIGL
jgi:hypothetical protein